MIIACPRCETGFSLPDEQYRPGKKARCSQCGNIFPMPKDDRETATSSGFGETAVPVKAEASLVDKRKKYLPFIIAAAALCLLLVLGYGGFLVYRSFTSTPGHTTQQDDTPRPDAAKQAEFERLISAISLDEVRQFVVDNAAIGRLAVVQGMAINVSQAPKEYIAVEARLLDANKRVLAQVQQLCGVPLTLFQLQSLSEQELQQALNNRISILTNNTNIPPGGKVSFMLVFTKIPTNMRTFEVRVIDVREAPTK